MVNKPLGDEIFFWISKYSFMHSSHFLTTAVTEGIRSQLSKIGDYMDSRI